MKHSFITLLILATLLVSGCITNSAKNTIEPVRATQDEFEEQIQRMDTGLTEEELLELNEISIMAVNALPANEREILLELQERFAYGGYVVLSDEEVATMQRLNNKAFSLLPEVYQERFYYLASKVEQ